MPSPTNLAVTRLISSASNTAAGIPNTSARRLPPRSSARSMAKSFLLRIPIIRYTPNSCLRLSI